MCECVTFCIWYNWPIGSVNLHRVRVKKTAQKPTEQRFHCRISWNLSLLLLYLKQYSYAFNREMWIRLREQAMCFWNKSLEIIKMKKKSTSQPVDVFFIDTISGCLAVLCTFHTSHGILQQKYCKERCCEGPNVRYSTVCC